MYTLERHSSFPSRKQAMFRFELNFTTCVRAYLPLPRHSRRSNRGCAGCWPPGSSAGRASHLRVGHAQRSMDQGHTHRRLAMPGRRLLRASDGRPVATNTRTHAPRTGRADGRPAAALAELRTCGSVARDGLWIRAIHTVVWQCRGAGCSAHLMAARSRTHAPDPIRVSSLVL